MTISVRQQNDARSFAPPLPGSRTLGLSCVPPLIVALQALSRARQANVLRHWLVTMHGRAPSAAQLDQLLDQVRACTTRGHRIHLKVADGFAQRKGERLHWYNRSPSPKASR